MTPDQWHARVGRRIAEQRGRTSIRAAATRAGISEGLWRQIESGRRPLRRGQWETVNPKPDTRRRVCEAIGWTADSIDRLLAGDEPRPLINQPDVEHRVARLERAVRHLLLQADATPDVDALLDAIRPEPDGERADR